MRLPRRDQSKIAIFGVGSYTHSTLSSVGAIERNVKDLAATLCDPRIGVFKRENCISVINPDSAYEIGKPLLEAARSAEDVFLVYYAGHGIVGPGGELYLTMRRTDPDAILFSALPYASIGESLRDSPARTRIVILDCCFSGRAIGNLADENSELLGQLAVDGTYLLTATTANAAALAPDGAQHTAFTGTLLDILQGKVADLPPNLTLGEIYRQLRKLLLQQGYPSPQQRGTDTAEMLVLSRGHSNTKQPDRAKSRHNSSTELALPSPQKRAGWWHKFGFHAGPWTYDYESGSCQQTRICTKCAAVQHTTSHNFKTWAWVEPRRENSCTQVATCARCGAAGKRHNHETRRVYLDNVTSIKRKKPQTPTGKSCEQTKICTQCNSVEGSKFTEHNWEDWRQDPVLNIQVRNCSRCGVLNSPDQTWWPT